MKDDEFSFSRNITCRNCQYIQNDNYNIIDINVKPFYEENMRILQHSINEKYSYKNTKCIRCDGENIECSVICGQLLFIDIECLQSIQMAKNLNILDWEGIFTLSNILVDLSFHKCIYKLLAVIEYQGTSDSVGHYIANIRRLTGKWEIHNDLCRNKKPLFASQRVMLQNKNYLY